MSTTPTPTAQSLFDAAYTASQPPPVRALLASPTGSRLATATQLAHQGYLIDVPIMVWGWDPYITMMLRAQFGYTWVPSALQLPIGAPTGYAAPGVPPNAGQTAYPTTPPTGSIPVLTSPSDYPPYGGPPAPEAPAFALGPETPPGSGTYVLLEEGTQSATVGEKLTVGTVSGTVVQISPFSLGLKVGS